MTDVKIPFTVKLQYSELCAFRIAALLEWHVAG